MHIDITSQAIITPAGACPHKLEGTSDEQVLAWVKRLRGSVSKMLTKKALRYWVRQSYGIFTDEQSIVCAKIDELVEEPRGYSSGA